MKFNKLYILGILLLTFTISFSACEEDDDYDYDAIEPKVQGIVGPTGVLGGFTHQYLAVVRGGSTYEFTSTGAIASITTLDEPHAVSVSFEESYHPESAQLTVVETTYGGIVSEPYTIDIIVDSLHLDLLGDTVVNVIEEAPPERTFTVEPKYPGATYSWSIDGDYLSIVGDNNSDAITVEFAFPPEEGELATIFVEVTTAGGNDLDSQLEVDIQQFCPIEIESMLGDWDGSIALAEGDCPQSMTITEYDDEEFEEGAGIIAYEVEGFADFLVSCFYGENWVEPEEGDGFFNIFLHEPDSEITIPLQHIGASDFPDQWWVKGIAFVEDADYHGVYNFCEPVITIKFDLAYGGEVGEDGLPVDEDELAWTWGEEGVTSTFTLSTDDKGNYLLQHLDVPAKK